MYVCKGESVTRGDSPGGEEEGGQKTFIKDLLKVSLG
jgi:hypothetical protein